MKITPTVRIVCCKCGDDMYCCEKDPQYGYHFYCQKCAIEVDMRMGWTCEKAIQ